METTTQTLRSETMATIHWRELEVHDDDSAAGSLGATALGEFVDDPDNVITDMDVKPDGSMGAWTDYFISRPGEEPDCDTPSGPVDWTGFAEAMEARPKA